MKIKEFYENMHCKYPNKLKIFKKGIFWILLEEEAFFMSKYFNFKITSLDKSTIKIGFPNSSKSKWLKTLNDKDIGYILIEKPKDEDFKILQITIGDYYSSIFSINLEDFLLTKDRILGLKKFDLEDKNEKNFLLQIKIEELYLLMSQLFIKLPKKERFYFRDKIERIFLDTLEILYKYKYNLDDRKNL
ncbi:MAG: hypothetical protein PHE25_05595 [Candidatus Gracilibacteria bacterium]|nr:hypothetical protein [Candidatus Gracilibacteria bacterium]